MLSKLLLTEFIQKPLFEQNGTTSVGAHSCPTMASFIVSLNLYKGCYHSFEAPGAWGCEKWPCADSVKFVFSSGAVVMFETIVA